MFSVKILAEWDAELAQRVYLDGKLLSNVTGFQVDCTCQISPVASGGYEQDGWNWRITVEELLPSGIVPDTNQSGAHTIKVVTAGGTEVYADGYWTEVCQTGGCRGVLQRRTFQCWSRTVE